MTSDWAMDVVELSSGDTEIFNTGGQWPPPISTGLGCPGGPSALPDVNPLVAELREGRRLQGKARAVDSRGLGGKWLFINCCKICQYLISVPTG